MWRSGSKRDTPGKGTTMNRLNRVSIRMLAAALVIGAVALAGSPVSAQGGLPLRAELGDGWNWLEPGGDTICSRGTPYTFAVREGPGDDLLIFFEGGGACWDALSCSEGAQLFNPEADPANSYIEIGDGLWDLGNVANPFADYDMIYIPYCTGDLHMGNQVVTYGEGDAAFEIHHKGYINATTVLNWVYANFDAPASVFVTGQSAGAFGSSFFAPFIMERYQGVPVTHLGDSGGALRGSLSAVSDEWGTIYLLPAWMPEFASTTPESLTPTFLYTAAAAHYSENMFATYNTMYDEVLTLFGLMLALETPEQALPANIAEISGAVPNFRYYVAGGSSHTILAQPIFYTVQVNGVRFVDWIAGLASGQDVPNVMCEECASLELAAP